MTSVTQLPATNQGFPIQAESWDEALARAMAKQDQLTLTPLHWDILNEIRAFYLAHGTPPSARIVCRRLEQKTQPLRFNCHTLKELFPRGLKQACRLAGVPEYYRFGC